MAMQRPYTPHVGSLCHVLFCLHFTDSFVKCPVVCPAVYSDLWSCHASLSKKQPIKLFSRLVSASFTKPVYQAVFFCSPARFAMDILAFWSTAPESCRHYSSVFGCRVYTARTATAV